MLRLEELQDTVENSENTVESVLSGFGCADDDIKRNVSIATQSRTKACLKFAKIMQPRMRVSPEGIITPYQVPQNCELIKISDDDTDNTTEKDEYQAAIETVPVTDEIVNDDNEKQQKVTLDNLNNSLKDMGVISNEDKTEEKLETEDIVMAEPTEAVESTATKSVDINADSSSLQIQQQDSSTLQAQQQEEPMEQGEHKDSDIQN